MNTPVLLIIFNRPETTQKVFDQITKIKPKKLFVAADAPRLHKPEDQKNCKKAREIINQITWPCEIKTLFRDENLGCGKGVSGAINWFFDHVESGIILEDDCVPDLSFFDFCASMLERYRDNNNVMMVAGTNYLFDKIKKPESYFFSKSYPIWGWATWRRAWQLYDFTIHDWSPEKPDLLSNFYTNKTVIKHWTETFEQIRVNKLDTWDIQWVYTCVKYHGYAIVPYTNLVSNIGLVGAHGNGNKCIFHEMPVGNINTGNLVYPACVMHDKKMDKITYDTIFRVIRPHYTFKSKIKKFLRFCLHRAGLRLM